MTDLRRAADAAIKDVLDVKLKERVLIVTNPSRDVLAISKALLTAARAAGAEANIIIQPVKTQLDVADRAVITALKTHPDVVISMSKEKIGKMPDSTESPLQRLLDAKRTRSFWSPAATTDLFARLVPIDYATLRTEVADVARLFKGGVSVRVTAPSGTDITVGISGRTMRKDDGLFRTPGSGGNLPAGEVYVSPALGSSNGRIVFDGSIASLRGMILIKTPITCLVQDGFVTDIYGGTEARRLRACLASGERMQTNTSAKRFLNFVRNIGEFGIGLNRKAGIVGNILEDEKAYGTCHFAIGSNFDGDAPSPIHLDGLVKRPTIRVTYRDGSDRVVMKNGRL
ncbi:MAG: hypothetical protein V1745_03260 [Patescibacteria group bacterium]